ncbi:MAG: M1 family metallopeptidase [Bacteroidota bacterium]
MNTWLAFVLCLSLVLAACSAPVQTQTPLPNAFNTPWADRSIFKSGLVQSQQSILDGLPGASVYHIELKLADDLFHVQGHEEVQYTNNETVPLKEVEFRLFPNILGGRMEVSQLVVDGQSVTPKLQLDDSLMIVALPAPLDPGKSIVIGMDFEVNVPQSVDLNYGVLADYQDVLALAHAYPMIAVYDDEGWNAEIPPQYGDVTYADAAFFLVKITAPQAVTVVTTGTVIDRAQGDEQQTLIVAEGPARDFYLAASPLYVEASKTIGEITINSYTQKGFEKGSQEALDTAAQAIQVFGRRYAPYPYTEFDIVATPNQALGIEYPGMVAIADRIYDVDETLAGTPVRVYLESTVAHETGHQWFYNLVGNDQLDDPWLDESLTQFATLQYYEDQDGEQAAVGFEQSLKGRWGRVNFEKIPIGLPVAKYSGQEYSSIVYGRGPLFFVALRDQMGEPAFDAFLLDYTQKMSWNIATPEFLQSLAEQHCTCDLDALFQEWVYPY